MPKKRANPSKRAETHSSGALTDASLAAAAAAAPTSLLVPPPAPPRQKPAITPIPPNTNLLARLNAFLPAMAQSNDALMAAIARDGRETYDIEHIGQRGGPVIQMKLGLGLFEGKSPTGATASGTTGNTDVVMTLDRLRLPGTGAPSSSSARRPGITDLTATVISDSSDSDSDSDASMADGDDEGCGARGHDSCPSITTWPMDVDSNEDDSSDDEEEGAGAPSISLEAMVTDFFNQGLDDSESEDENAVEDDESSDEEMEERRP
ncbi:hypothetical protein AMAG_12721 [Allomyces macrogynus ATCC 38327]|uniref:Uncharacterized protein n=1 Tax=Allomyces macrogynus (strain ATCC 38327) TaxID=578462 RepID=A0A0L0T1E7_ALLM3|nr:hypothetical protein AMAG_12721 [Allomyces macrogynus ATCC 38327]|eukprot:KNE68552.1 hypothetical protein AMAG_12721 [Allomyces macrogynus ATCC 38327]